MQKVVSIQEPVTAPGGPDVYLALHEWRSALRDFLQTSGDIVKHHGLTPQQYQAMLAMKVAPGTRGLTVSELAHSLRVRHNSTVMLVDQLCTKKLVRRAPCKEDRRCVLLHLTEAGETLLQELARSHRRELQRIGPQVIEILGKASTP